MRNLILWPSLGPSAFSYPQILRKSQNSMFFDERRNQRGQESSIREGLWWPPFLNSLTALGAGNDPTRRNRHSVPQGGIPVMAI
jgi:hypothetical protein